MCSNVSSSSETGKATSNAVDLARDEIKKNDKRGLPVLEADVIPSSQINILIKGLSARQKRISELVLRFMELGDPSALQDQSLAHCANTCSDMFVVAQHMHTCI